jgi:hypothetical protein
MRCLRWCSSGNDAAEGGGRRREARRGLHFLLGQNSFHGPAPNPSSIDQICASLPSQAPAQVPHVPLPRLPSGGIYDEPIRSSSSTVSLSLTATARSDSKIAADLPVSSRPHALPCSHFPRHRSLINAISFLPYVAPSSCFRLLQRGTAPKEVACAARSAALSLLVARHHCPLHPLHRQHHSCCSTR